MTDDELSKLFPGVSADRPLECCECKKKINVLYTEVTKDHCTHTAMCADCPELEAKLHGKAIKESALADFTGANLCCGTCKTTLTAVRTGHELGCSDCYEVFDDFIRKDLLLEKHLPERFESVLPNASMHIGKTAAVATAINPSLKLVALNEALTEMLKKEDYEQAAALRDQIKKLTENQNG